MESYEERLEESISVINIPIDIELDELEASLNRNLSGTLYEDNSLKDGDKMKVRAVKQADFQLGLEQDAVTYKVPLDLWIQYDIGISKVEASGQIALDFKTGFEFSENWDILTKTEVLSYSWAKKPRLKMGMVNLPIGFIADLVLKRSKSAIASSIDELVKEQFDLRKTVEEAWQQMFEPTLVAEAYNTWLTVNPQFIGMSPMEMGNGRIRSTIYVEGKPSVTVGEKPAPSFVKPLPPLRISPVVSDEFTLHLNTQISYKEAERIAKAELLGETFSYGKRAVTIEDLEFYGQGSKIVVNTVLSGTYDGSIYLTGQPVYNPKKNTVELQDLDYTMNTRSALFRSAGWLLKSAIKKKIKRNFNFLLDYNLKDMQQQFQEQLRNYKVSEGITLNGELRDLSLQNAFLTPDGIVVDLALQGNLNVAVRGLY